jgi:hypothetical protein
MGFNSVFKGLKGFVTNKGHVAEVFIFGAQ